MQQQRPFGCGTVWALATALALTTGAERAPAQGMGASTVLRTLVYHEITSLTASPNSGSGEHPVLSANGTRAVFAMAPGTGNPAQPNRIFVVNADGSGLREVDSYTTRCYCGSLVDISADGSKVLSSDAVQLRIANADGSGGRELLALNSNEFSAIRISGDGSKVFFHLRRDAGLADGTPLPAGVYVINADGSGRRRIVGAPEIAALLGMPESQVPFGASGAYSLAVSATGSRLAFESFIQPGDGGAGQGVFAVNLDGSGLVSLTGRQNFASVAISGDGATVGYNIVALDNTAEVGVVGANGTRRALARQPAGQPSPFPTGFPAVFQDRLQLSADGSQLLVGSPGVLVNTATGDALQLAVRGGWYSSDPAPLLYDGLYDATMNDSASRFLYLASDAKGIRQLATLDLNPASLGGAPSITGATVNPPFILTGRRSAATLSAQVSATGTLVRVSGAVLRSGLVDPVADAPVLLDDGTNGDARSGDSIFTNNSLATSDPAPAGPRTVRIKAEVRAGDGRRHATAVEIAPFAVLTAAPPAGGGTP